LNTYEKLGDDICKRFTEEKMDILSLSEVSTLKAVNYFASKSPDIDIDFVHSGKRSDYIVQVWDIEKFKLDGNIDVSSNYIGVPLTCHENEEKHLHISVHLPHKTGRRKVQNNLKQYVNEKLTAGDCKQIFIHGDFNITQTDISELFPLATLTIAGNTTKANTEKDNIIYLDDDIFFEGQIVTEGHEYTHHIIKSSFSFE
jgi:hypothetical protein